MPDAKIELDYTTPLELLVAVILSAQCTDKRVNMVTPALFKAFPSPAAYAKATPAELEPFIKTCGLYQAKAKNIVSCCKTIVESHGGVVPPRRAELAELAGVGNKTAGVVSMHLPGGDPSFPVDTHVARLSFRMGLTTREAPDKIELDVAALLPSSEWSQAHQLLVWHGRRICTALKPGCDGCVVNALCPKKGVKKPKVARA